MLRYFLFMSRMSRQVQWGIILGGYFGYQALRSAEAAHPALRPFVTPVLLAYTLFAVMTWLAGPAFNLLLRIDRFGRYALSVDQRRASNLFGLCLLAAAGLVVAWLATGDPRFALAAVVAGVLSIPTTAVFHLPTGWPRWTMAAVTAAMAGVGATVVAATFAADPDGSLARAGRSLGPVFLYGVVGANLLANALAGARVRR